MIIITLNKWRKVGRLSATFLFGLVLLAACKKETPTIGKDLIDQDALLKGNKVDTFSLTSYSYLEDSIETRNVNRLLLGEFYDPVFGRTKASFYTQLRLASLNPDFGDTTNLLIDSVVLALDYTDFQGGFDEQTFEVYELDEELSSSSDTKYYQFSELDIKNSNLMLEGFDKIEPNPTVPSIVNDEIADAQLRLRLDPEFGRQFIRTSILSPEVFQSEDAFVESYKGLHVRVNNQNQSPAEGGIYYFDPSDADTKLIIYYTQDGSQKLYDIPINAQSVHFNHFEASHAGTDIEELLNDPSKGQKEFFAQSFGLRAAIELNGISDLPENAVIHKAELFVPVQHQIGGLIDLPTSLSVSIRKDPNSFDLSSALIQSVIYSEFSTGYTINLRPYLQSVLSGVQDLSPIILYPLNWNVSAERVIFNGPNTDNKLQPKLTVVYTEF